MNPHLHNVKYKFKACIREMKFISEHIFVLHFSFKNFMNNERGAVYVAPTYIKHHEALQCMIPFFNVV